MSGNQDKTFRHLARPTLKEVDREFYFFQQVMEDYPDWKLFLHDEDYVLAIKECNYSYRNWPAMVCDAMTFLEDKHYTMDEFLNHPDMFDCDISAKFPSLYWLWLVLFELQFLPIFDDSTEEWTWTQLAADHYRTVHESDPPGILLDK